MSGIVTLFKSIYNAVYLRIFVGLKLILRTIM